MYNLSIIIPIYQIKEEYLRQCIDSLILQTMNEIEIILVDDGSTNGCGKICDDYAIKDSRIKVIHQKNQGVSMARNAGMKIASSEWITFVDPDDWIEKNMCERVYKELINDPNIDIIMWGHAVNWGNYQEDVLFGYESRIDFSNEEKEELLHRLLNGSKYLNTEWMRYKICGAVWGKCFSKKKLKSNNIVFFKELKKSQDLVFNLYAIEMSQKISYIDEVLYHYRQNSISICNRYNTDIEDSYYKVLQRIKEYIDKYKKNDKIFESSYLIYKYNSYRKILSLKYFHKNNKNQYNKNRKEWLNLVNNNYYADIFNSFNISDDFFSNSKIKIIIWLSRNKQFFLLKILYKIKNAIEFNNKKKF